jgi:hypothetical protein
MPETLGLGQRSKIERKGGINFDFFRLVNFDEYSIREISIRSSLGKVMLMVNRIRAAVALP